jgi:hypothetical protein
MARDEKCLRDEVNPYRGSHEPLEDLGVNLAENVTDWSSRDGKDGFYMLRCRQNLCTVGCLAITGEDGKIVIAPEDEASPFRDCTKEGAPDFVPQTRDEPLPTDIWRIGEGFPA